MKCASVYGVALCVDVTCPRRRDGRHLLKSMRERVVLKRLMLLFLVTCFKWGSVRAVSWLVGEQLIVGQSALRRAEPPGKGSFPYVRAFSDL